MNNKIKLSLVAALGMMLSMGVPAAQASAPESDFLADAPSTTVSVASDSGDVSTSAECYYPIISGDGGALVCFNPYGEHLYICDNAADGHHPVGRYYRSDKSGLKTKHATPQNGACYDHNLAIPESGWINYQACNYEKSTLLSCSSFRGRIGA